jgi:hypothetical protein
MFKTIEALFWRVFGTRHPTRGNVYEIIQLERWGGAGNPVAMTWKDCHPRTRAVFKAELTCPNGHGVSLRNHSIGADGRVAPSVVCLGQGCDFHAFVQLKDWSAGTV